MPGIIDTHDNDRTHYHVVAFINGCLNDYDSGPIDTFEDAVAHLRDYMNDGGMQPDTEVTDVFGETRYQQGRYTIQVESCQEEACSIELAHDYDPIDEAEYWANIRTGGGIL